MKLQPKTPFQGESSRRLVRWRELALAFAVVAVCLGVLLLRQGGIAGNVAQVYIDGNLVRSLSLSGGNTRVDLQGEYGVPVSLELEGGRICFVDVTCPDHLCEKTGFIYTEGQTAVCMPNRVAVVIEGAQK